MRPLRLALAAVLLLAAPRAAAAAGEFVAVCDREIAPYRALLEGFEKACGAKVLVVPPAEALREGFERRLRDRGVRGILAVGIDARDAVEAVAELPVLLAMVPRADRWAAARPNRFGIEMALSPRRHLETIRRVFPAARRVGLVYDPKSAGDYVREAREAAAALRLALETREIARAGELSGHIEELRRRIDVFWLLPDPALVREENLHALLLASFESRFPIYGFARKYVDLGAVAAAHLEPASLGAQAARMLSCLPAPGPRPAAARWEYALGATLVLNEKVARKMGVALPPKVLEAADDVVR